MQDTFESCPRCGYEVIALKGKTIHDGCEFMEVSCINPVCGLTHRCIRHLHIQTDKSIREKIVTVSYLPRRAV